MKIIILLFICFSLNVYARSPKYSDTDKDGMNDYYERKHRLKVGENDADKDLDGDGFTNYEEYTSYYDVQDPKSHPPLITDLSIKKFIVEVFPIKFLKLVKKGKNKEDWLIHIAINDKSYIKKLGDKIKVGNDQYKISDAIYKTTERFIKEMGRPMDVEVSEIFLENSTKNDEKYELTVGKTKYKPPRVILLDKDKNEITKSINEVISLGNKIIGIEKYEVTHINPRQGYVGVKDSKGKQFEIKVPQQIRFEDVP